MKKPHHILIAGAGLVGSLLALMLGQRGYRVTVLEKREDMRRKSLSAGRSINLALAERGINALRRAGLMEEVEKLLIPMKGRVLHGVDSELLFSPYGQRPHEVIYSVSRGELNQLMMTAAETHFDVDILFNQSIETVDFDQKKVSIKDHLADKTTQLEFELVIGADGVGSEVRKAIVEATCGNFQIDMLGHDYKELCIPPGSEIATRWQMEKEALHIWPRGGYMLIALPNLDGSFTVTLFLPRKGDPSFELIDEPHELHDFFVRQFPDAKALIPNFQEEYFGNPIGQLGTVRCDRWVYNDSAFILGDASHGIVPFHGQGMNAGFEDCSELIRLLDEHADDWSTVLPIFEEIRMPNANAIADMALENYVTMRDSVNDEKFKLKKEIGFELERMFPDRFIPRYSMVMFHRYPYADAFSRGQIQDDILNDLANGIESASEFDRQRGKELVESRLQEIAQPA